MPWSSGSTADASARRLGKGPAGPCARRRARARVAGRPRRGGLRRAVRRGHAARADRALGPDVLVKGADYTRDPIVGADIVEARGGRVSAIPLVHGLLHHRHRGASPCPVLMAAPRDSFVPSSLERRANPYAEGSCLIRMGGTLVHCTASVETGVPGFKKGTGEGWVTAEYAMLPRATAEAHPAGAQRTGRSDPGDPAAHRAIAPRGHGDDGVRRVHHPDRLRRAPGRWRHPHREHHRRRASRSRMPAPGWPSGPASPRRSEGWSPPCRSGSWRARSVSIWPTSRIATRRWTRTS